MRPGWFAGRSIPEPAPRRVALLVTAPRSGCWAHCWGYCRGWASQVPVASSRLPAGRRPDHRRDARFDRLGEFRPRVDHGRQVERFCTESDEQGAERMTAGVAVLCIFAAWAAGHPSGTVKGVESSYGKKGVRWAARDGLWSCVPTSRQEKGRSVDRPFCASCGPASMLTQCTFVLAASSAGVGWGPDPPARAARALREPARTR